MIKHITIHYLVTCLSRREAETQRCIIGLVLVFVR